MAREFYVTVDNPEEGGLGMKLDLTDNRQCVVDSLQSGAIESYNDSVSHDMRVRPGDAIMAVNGFSGHPQEMTVLMSSSPEITLKVRRPTDFSVAVDKAGDQGLGLSLAEGANSHGLHSLLIREVCAGSAAEWNAQYPELALVRGDRIIQVNDRTGTQLELLEAMSDAETCLMKIRRYVEEEVKEEPQGGLNLNVSL
eukprot:gb/GFBE01078989.1/.p1 GENE.gb/GFBE01078989.1/~~gb/GFBE01078989.1/.p1  ORF type:complete len:197 (+),score=39.87 gb/GFBE01078989.1/:1-591(+)